MSAPASTLHTPAARIKYTREALLQRRDNVTTLPRKVRRSLWYFGFLHCSPCHAQVNVICDRCLPSRHHVATIRLLQDPRPQLPPPSSSSFTDTHQHLSRPIPVRITNRGGRIGPNKARPRCLIRVKTHAQEKPRRPRKVRISPSILVSNTRCLRNKVDEFEDRMRTLEPDVAILTETWLDDTIPDSAITPANYTTCRKDRNAQGGGIACFIKNSFTFSAIDHTSISTPNDCESEILSLFVNELKLLVIGVYHPFWKNPAQDVKCIDHIVSIIDYVRISCHCDPSDLKIVVCGDFNDISQRYDEVSRLTLLSPVVHSPTRDGKTLDQIFSNYCPDHASKLFPPFGRSDHAVIFWNPTSRVTVTKKAVRNINPSNMADFHRCITNVDWSALVSHFPNLDDAASIFQDLLFYLFNLCFPFKNVRLRSSDPPWWNHSLKILIDARDRAFSKRQWQKYRTLREKVIKQTAKLKQTFLLNENHSSSNSWKAIRCVGKINKRASRVTTSRFSVSDFNDYFASSFQSSGSILPRPSSSMSSNVSCHLTRLLHFWLT